MKKLTYLFLALLIVACSDDSSDNGNVGGNDGCLEYGESPTFIINCSDIPYPSIIYGTQEWTTENACHTTYRDGTPIPQVANSSEWENLDTGAWCYYDNDPTKGKLYNFWAIIGKHDNDFDTPYKNFAPEGWHVPLFDEWTTFYEYLINNGYNSGDVSSDYNKLAKSLASSSGWFCFDGAGTPGDTQSTNNSTEFNAFPVGWRFGSEQSSFTGRGALAKFWTSSSAGGQGTSYGKYIDISWGITSTDDSMTDRIMGMSVRLVKD